MRADGSAERATRTINESTDMKTMTARFPGKCAACGGAIFVGDTIDFYGRGHAEHHQCEGDSESGVSDDVDYHDGEFPPSPAVLANDRKLARRGLSVVRFSSGHVMTQNSRGRCEDAPCCGCCT